MERRFLGLTGNQLKMIALITMTIDHVGAYLFPQAIWLRMIGRMSMPIYAFMIAQGCRHTHSRPKYLGLVALLALIWQVACFVAEQSISQTILVTFSISISLIYLIDFGRNKKTLWAWLAVAAGFAAAIFVCQFLPGLVRGYNVSYNFFGVLLPVLFYLGRNHKESMILGAVGTLLVIFDQPWVQWYSLIALPLLALYNGKRGTWNLKYVFYLYYPIHLVVIYGIGMLMRHFS